MRHRPDRGLLAAALLAIALLASGCGIGSKNPTGPGTSDLTQSEANDVALQTAFALDQMGVDMEGAGGSLLMGPALRQGARPMHAAWNTSITSEGLSAEFSHDFYDAGNNLLEAYGPTAVRMNWKSHIWGTLESLRDTATIQHHANLDLTGIQLLDTALVINGTCADTLFNRFHSLDSLLARYGYWRSTLTAAAIALRKEDGMPLSGTLTYVVKLDKLRSGELGDVEKQLRAIVVITFNGTRYPDVVVNGVYHFKWDKLQGTMILV